MATLATMAAILAAAVLATGLARATVERRPFLWGRALFIALAAYGFGVLTGAWTWTSPAGPIRTLAALIIGG